MSNQNVSVRWLEKRQFEGQSGAGHKVKMDGPPAHGGEDQGIRPMEMILLGLGGCASFDVVAILEKKRVELEICQVQIDAERSDTVPAVFTKIQLSFEIKAKQPEKLTEKAASQAVSLSVDKFCSVASMLAKGGVEVCHRFELLS